MALHAEILAQSAQCTVSEGGSQGKSPEERNRTTLLYYMLCRASRGLWNALGGVGACELQRTLPNLRQTAGMTGSDAHEAPPIGNRSAHLSALLWALDLALWAPGSCSYVTRCANPDTGLVIKSVASCRPVP